MTAFILKICFQIRQTKVFPLLPAVLEAEMAGWRLEASLCGS
jgi:hypothetical protein